jgi:hypothetical protein
MSREVTFSASFLFSLNFWSVFVSFLKMQYLKIRLSWVMMNSLQHILQHPSARELSGKSQYEALYNGAHISTLVNDQISYFHHGIVVNVTEDANGNKDEVTIVHFSGAAIFDKSKARIQTCNLLEFTAGYQQRLFLIDYEDDSPRKQHESACVNGKISSGKYRSI